MAQSVILALRPGPDPTTEAGRRDRPAQPPFLNPCRQGDRLAAATPRTSGGARLSCGAAALLLIAAPVVAAAVCALSFPVGRPAARVLRLDPPAASARQAAPAAAGSRVRAVAEDGGKQGGTDDSPSATTVPSVLTGEPFRGGHRRPAGLASVR